MAIPACWAPMADSLVRWSRSAPVRSAKHYVVMAAVSAAAAGAGSVAMRAAVPGLACRPCGRPSRDSMVAQKSVLWHGLSGLQSGPIGSRCWPFVPAPASRDLLPWRRWFFRMPTPILWLKPCLPQQVRNWSGLPTRLTLPVICPCRCPAASRCGSLPGFRVACWRVAPNRKVIQRPVPCC